MDNVIYILFVCIFAPLSFMMFLLPRRARLIIGFMMTGICVSLFVSEINTLVLRAFNRTWVDSIYVTTTITPIIEEISKAFPILVYAFLLDDDKDKLLANSLALGIGFGFFENTVILIQNIDNVTFSWALARGCSTALMHGMCTMAVGFGISFVKKKKKLFYCGTFALLTAATIYHGIYNMLVQADLKALGVALPTITYLPIVYQRHVADWIKNYRQKKGEKEEK